MSGYQENPRKGLESNLVPLVSESATLRGIMNADQSLLTVRQAAERLGISVEATRARLSRGTLERVDGPDGTVYVRLHAEPRSDQSTDQSMMLQRADSEIAYLRERLAAADERDREQRRIIAALTARIPELPNAPPEASDSEAAVSDAEPRPGQTPPEPQTTPAKPRVPWWRRVFGQRS